MYRVGQFLHSNSIGRSRGVVWLILAVLACVIEGAFRKWVVPGNRVLGIGLYFSKDLILAGLAFVAIQRAELRPNIQRFQSQWLIAATCMVIFGALVSSTIGINYVGAVITLRTLVFLPVAATLVCRLLPSTAFSALVFFVALISIPSAGLGVIQFFSPNSAIINRFEAEDSLGISARVDDHVRASGTYAYISGFGSQAVLGVWASLAALCIGTTLFQRVLGATALLSAFCMTLVTASRGIALSSLLLLVVWLIFDRSLSTRIQSLVIALMVLGALVFALGGAEEIIDITTTTYERHAQSSDAMDKRLEAAFVESVVNGATFAPIGNGLGFEQTAGMVAANSARLNATIESGWGRVILEVGIIGAIGSTLAIIAAVVSIWQLASRISDPRYKSALRVTAAACGVFALGGIQFNHIASFFFWSLFAVAMSTAKFEDRSKFYQ